VVPPDRVELLEQSTTWDEWDPDTDRWYYDWEAYTKDNVWDRQKQP